MQEHHKQIDNFFHKVSRYILIVPIVVVLVALFLKLTTNSQQKGFTEYKAMATPAITQSLPDIINKATPSAKFNLTGPLTCSFSAEDSMINAYVKEKKIYIKMGEKNVISNYLLNGDCVYIWKSGIYTGEKICGISQQVAIVDGLLSSGLINPDLVFGGLGKMFDLPDIGDNQDILKSAMSSCKNEEVPSSIGFSVPKNILFKNQTLK